MSWLHVGIIALASAGALYQLLAVVAVLCHRRQPPAPPTQLTRHDRIQGKLRWEADGLPNRSCDAGRAGPPQSRDLFAELCGAGWKRSIHRRRLLALVMEADNEDAARNVNAMILVKF